MGREATWHGKPRDGVAFLRGVPVAEARWLTGVCLGAAGRYGEAFEVLGEVERDGTGWPSLMASTLGSLHRQLGRHEAGRAHDLAALELAGEDREARVDALLGLAADAVGVGDVATAKESWERAAQVAGAVEPDGTGWRGQVRLRWVEAEIELMQGRAPQAVGPALAAVELARRSRAPRHEAKSLMFAGVALAESPGDTGRGLELLREGLATAVGLGCDPLVRPLGDYVAARTGDEDAARAAAAATARIAAALPPGIPWPPP